MAFLRRLRLTFYTACSRGFFAAPAWLFMPRVRAVFSCRTRLSPPGEIAAASAREFLRFCEKVVQPALYGCYNKSMRLLWPFTNDSRVKRGSHETIDRPAARRSAAAYHPRRRAGGGDRRAAKSGRGPHARARAPGRRTALYGRRTPVLRRGKKAIRSPSFT